MSDAYQDSIMPVFLLLIAAFIVGKALVKVGLLTNKNCNTISTALSVVAGAAYALLFEQGRSIELPDIVVRIGAGAMVTVITWVFITMGIGASLPVTFDKGEDQTD